MHQNGKNNEMVRSSVAETMVEFGAEKKAQTNEAESASQLETERDCLASNANC